MRMPPQAHSRIIEGDSCGRVEVKRWVVHPVGVEYDVTETKDARRLLLWSESGDTGGGQVAHRHAIELPIGGVENHEPSDNVLQMKTRGSSRRP
jgi:hypothetical protein